MGAISVQALAPDDDPLNSELLMRFRLLADCSPTGLFLLDHRGRCVYLNARAAAICRLNPPIGYGRPWVEVFGVEDPNPVLESWYAGAFSEYSGSFRLHTASSFCHWVEVRTAPVFHQEKIIGYSGVVRDISDRSLRERLITSRDAITRILASSGSIDVARKAILNEIGETLGWAIGVFWEPDGQSGTLKPTAAWRKPAAHLRSFETATCNTSLPLGIGLPGRVWSTREPAWIPDVTLDPNFPRRRAARKAGLHGALAFPILIGDETLAVIEIFSSAVWEPDPDLLQSVSVIASQIGQYLARKRQENELRQSEQRFWHVAQNIGEVLWIADPRLGRLVYISPAFETIWGRPCQEVLRAPDILIEGIHPDDRDRVLAFREQAYRGVTSEQEYRVIRPDGSIRWIRDLAFPVNNSDGLEHVVGLAVDVSERIVREQRREQHAKAEALSALAGGLAHNLNNLLTGVLGNAALAFDMLPDSHPARALLVDVTTSGERAAFIVAQILAYSGKGRFVNQYLDLSAVVRDFLNDVAGSISPHIELRTNLADALPRFAGDRNQILQLLGNLYLNAVEAIGDRPGTIFISTGLEGCDSGMDLPEGGVKEPNSGFVYLRVSDTGCGIEEAIRPRIFDPFFTTKFIGRGLGLSAAQGIVQAHNGVIRVSTEPGRGSSFVCLFRR